MSAENGQKRPLPKIQVPSMSKLEFLRLMKFPREWVDLDMYPDELFNIQAPRYQPGHELGAEHDRNGAFHWWLHREPTKSHLRYLLMLASLDPDPLLGQDLRQYIRRAKSFDDEASALEQQLFS